MNAWEAGRSAHLLIDQHPRVPQMAARIDPIQSPLDPLLDDALAQVARADFSRRRPCTRRGGSPHPGSRSGTRC
ncbi:MAG TPA: hypothetical protein VGF67_30485 [Ktedonobacteraceae bacterium]